MQSLFQYSLRPIVGLLLATIVLFSSCKEDTPETYSPIKIGADQGVSSIELNKEGLRTLILSGGNNKYSVEVEDSKIARVTLSQDTLRVKALLEGETYATVRSHDMQTRLKINVVYKDVSISSDVVKIVAGQENTSVQLAGGGDIADLEVDDPDGALASVRWNGSTDRLHIMPNYEGQARITIKGQGGKSRTVTVVVAPEGETLRPGLYSTRFSSYYELLGTTVAIHRPGVGVWLTSTPTPKKGRHIKLPALKSPKEGSYLDVKMEIREATKVDEFTTGTYRVKVKEVRKRHVVLLGRGFRLVVPYDN